MTDHDAKEHCQYTQPQQQRYEINDIVELRNPKGILGVIKYIGAKKNSAGSAISDKIHYVIQLEEYVGNGNGSWNGCKYIGSLRPDKTMELCKINNIRCKRSSDDVLKALYNILRAYNKLKIQIKRQQSYINELEEINYKFEQRLQSHAYYFIEPKTSRSTNIAHDIHPHNEHDIEYEANALNTRTSSPQKSIQAQSPLVLLRDASNCNVNMNRNPTQIIASTSNLNQHTPHPVEFGGRPPSKSSLVAHSATAFKTCTNSMDPIIQSMDDMTQNVTSIRSEDADDERELAQNGNFSRSEKWVTLNTNQALKDMITPPPVSTLQKVKRSHRRNQSKDLAQNINNNNDGYRYLHHRHQSATFVVDGATNLSQITDLERNESDLTNNTMNNNVEITPAPIVVDNLAISEFESNEYRQNNLQNIESVSVKQKRKDIEMGGNVDTVGKLQLIKKEVKRQKSIEKVKNAKIVNEKVNVFENMIKKQDIETEKSNKEKTKSNVISSESENKNRIATEPNT